MITDPIESAALGPIIVRALSAVYDPEIPVNIYELGLIYDIIVDASSRVGIRMSLTAPAVRRRSFCRAGEKAAAAVPGVTDVTVDVVWDPPWTRERMSDAAKLQLGLF